MDKAILVLCADMLKKQDQTNDILRDNTSILRDYTSILKDHTSILTRHSKGIDSIIEMMQEQNVVSALHLKNLKAYY